jgi:hypothetical protein
MTGTLRTAAFALRRKPRPVRQSLTRPSWPASHPLS